MIENLPDVSHLRYRGERVEWREGVYFGGWRLVAASAEARSINYLAVVIQDYGGFCGGAFNMAGGLETVGGDDFEHDDAAVVAVEVIRRLLVFGVLTSVDGHETGDAADVADDGHAFILSPELLALASAVAQRQGQSLDDLLTRIVTTKVVSIAVVDYRDDPEIRRLHIDLAESWGKE